ncbi:MAG TPA: type II toxin-antitoxin system VapC family toxin [Bryobacteraceae bacterium]|nr:type II toxin-antitoxin system VapC family toxin [Bryobacteraceae bacterium]
MDSSAIVAVMLQEPGCELILDRIGAAGDIAVGAPTAVEAAMLLSSRLGRDARPRLLQFLREAEVEIIPFGAEYLDTAVDAFLRYGKGRHPAGLNFGDCLAYAVSRFSGVPLIFAGNDFRKADLPTA